jgi:ketosteroid isomerase-like protein
MTNVETVRYVYERFAQNDARSILATFDPNIEFRLAHGHPYSPDGQPWIGPDSVTRNFFMRAGSEWHGWSVAIDHIIETTNAVIVECRYGGLYKPTGRTLDVQVCHVWRFSDSGKITSFHQYVDTARLQHVMGVTPTNLDNPRQTAEPAPSTLDG